MSEQATASAPTVAIPVPLNFVPATPEDFAVCLSDPMWRLCSGQLYKIKTKPKTDDGSTADEDEALIVPFKPNRAQKKLIKKLHQRNIILKARQLGFTTFIAILFLDTALFAHKTRPTSAAIVAQTDDVAKEIFRDKIKFAYDELPAALREAMPLMRDRADKLEFAHNGSWVRVSTSFRGGTLTHLHISEFGKICAENDKRANEVVTGSIPAAEAGMIFIESTAEGRDGHFYKMCQRARKVLDFGRKLTKKEFKFHFFPWWEDMQYRMDPDNVSISSKEHEYFDEVEGIMKCSLDIEQRAWWISVRDNVYSGEDEMMWQEYPSTPDEAFQVSTKGCYYSVQMTRARKAKRIGTVPFTPGIPVNTYWDIGNSDGTAIWFHQQVGAKHHFINFIEGWGEPYSYYVSEMQRLADKDNWIWGRHYLPHDGNHERQGEVVNTKPKTMLENLGLRKIEIVPRVSEIQHGIQVTRDILATVWIDAEGCKEGIVHLDSYRKKWSDTQGCFMDEPLHDVHSEGADSFRQFAQVHTNNSNNVQAGSRPRRRNKSAMAS